jgi:hypothetical protein
MGKTSMATFQAALEAVESLPRDQQEDLVDVLRRRLVDSRREVLARVIKEAREDYTRGHVKRGTVDDLLKDLAR